jgi:lysophospholipase L1-like esterase
LHQLNGHGGRALGLARPYRASRTRRTRSSGGAVVEALEARTLLTGSGLTGVYHDTEGFGGESVTRVDPTIDFTWPASPAPGIDAETFSVEWSGAIVPRFSQAYTFHVAADEGARLWVNGRLLIDNWAAGGAASSAAITLQAGQQYAIGLELRDVAGAASAKLEWSSASQARQVVPQSSLYSQLPGGPAFTVMPLGDSITQAQGGNGVDAAQASYRYWLYKQLQYGGFSPDFVGSQVGHFDGLPRYTNFDLDHEGHWGYTTDQVLANMDAWAAARPEVVLLHLGTNDIFAEQPNDQTAAEVGQIIDRLRAANPSVTVLLARIIPSQFFVPPAQQDLNTKLSALAAAKTTPQSPVIVVDQATGFNAFSDTYDGVHPNESGEKKMAERWMAAIRSAVTIDATPPAVESARISSPSSIELTFTEPVSAASGTAAANYALSGGARVSAATLSQDGRMVRLSTTPLTPGAAYVLGVSNIADRSAAANLIAAGTAVNLNFDPVVFYRGIDVGGIALEVDGNRWEGADAPDYSVESTAVFFDGIDLLPLAEPDREQVVRSTVFNLTGVDFEMTDVPVGRYRVYYWTHEDDLPSTYDILLEGQVVRTGYISGIAGSWERVGPLDVTVTDGTLNLTTIGGDANLSGVEVYRVHPTAGVSVDGTAGADTVHIRPDAAGVNLQVWVNSDPASAPPDRELPMVGVGSLTINALGGDDVLVLDHPAGAPWGGPVIGFEGGAGRDSLRVLSTAASPEPLVFQGAGLEVDSGFVSLGSVEALDLRGGIYDFIADAAGLDVSLSDASVRFSASQNPASLELLGGSTAALAAGGDRYVRTTNLTLGPLARLDVADNVLIIPASAQTAQQVRQEAEARVRSARNGGAAGAWSGPGITSSAAANRPLFGLAPVINRDDSGAPLLSSVAGVPVDADTVLVKYALNGDTNLDGRVNISDLFRTDAGRAMRRGGWENGDFDLSGGPANADDYMLIDRSFMAQGAGVAAAAPAPLAVAATETAELWGGAQGPEDEVLTPVSADVL